MSDTARVGAPFSLPLLPTLDGAAWDPEALRGTKVLLFMWGSW